MGQLTDNFKPYQSVVSIEEIDALKLRPDEKYFAYGDFFPPNPEGYLFIQSNNRPIGYKRINLEYRNDDIRTQLKKVKKIRLKREFNLKNSVFREWCINGMEDNFKKAFEADMTYSKINRFVKDKLQY